MRPSLRIALSFQKSPNFAYMSATRNGQLRQAARQLHAVAFILPSVILGVLINIPKFFETEHVLVDVTDQEY